jgi:hypothetical protein
VLPWPKNAQFTPSEADLLKSTSTMIASTSTCARRMSSLSMTDMRLRMTFGVAVITSAFVCRIRPDDGAALGLRLRGLRTGRAAARSARGAGNLFFQFRGDFFGIAILKVTHLRLPARLHRGVEVRDQDPDAQARVLSRPRAARCWSAHRRRV